MATNQDPSEKVQAEPSKKVQAETSEKAQAETSNEIKAEPPIKIQSLADTQKPSKEEARQAQLDDTKKKLDESQKKLDAEKEQAKKLEQARNEAKKKQLEEAQKKKDAEQSVLAASGEAEREKKEKDQKAEQKKRDQAQKDQAKKNKEVAEAGETYRRQEEEIVQGARKAESSKAKGLHVLYNRRPEPLPGFRFKVYVNHFCMGFTKITNLEETSEVTALQEGGVNEEVHILEVPTSTEHTLVMERGVVLSTLTGMILNRQLDIGQRVYGDIMISLHNRNGWVGRCFWVSGAYVKKITYDGLDSMNGNPVIQRFEIAYEKMETMGLPGIPDAFY